MSQVVNHPGRQELPQCDRAEARVFAGQIELGVGQAPGLEYPEALGPEAREFVEERIEGALGIPGPVAETIVRLEPPTGTLRENDAGAKHPIGFLAIDQVPDVVEGAERIGPFRASNPWRTDPVQERA